MNFKQHVSDSRKYLDKIGLFFKIIMSEDESHGIFGICNNCGKKLAISGPKNHTLVQHLRANHNELFYQSYANFLLVPAIDVKGKK